MVFVVIKIITQELEIESNLKQRLEFICDFCNINPKFVNGSILKIVHKYFPKIVHYYIQKIL